MGDVDGGYAWVALAAATFITSITSICSMGAIGAMYVEILNYFSTAQKFDVALVASIQIATIGVMGCLLGRVVQKYGCRLVVAVGSIISTIGLVASTFVPNLRGLYLSYAVCTGVGCVSGQIASLVAVQLSFHAKRALALGILFSAGVGTGPLIGPPLYVLLSETYALPGVFLILAGLQLQCVWLGFLFRPFSAPPQQPPQKTTTEVKEDNNEDIEQTDPWVKKEGGKTVTYQEPPETQPAQQKNALQRGVSCICGGLANALGVAPCRNIPYLLFTISVYFEQIGHLVPYTLLVLRGVKDGNSEAKSALLITVLAVAAIPSRLICGFLGDFFPDKRKYLCALAVLLTGLLNICSAPFSSYTYLMIYTATFGFLSSGYIVYQLAVVVDVWGRDVVEWFAAHIFVCFGAGMFTMSPIAGLIIDNTDDITLPFIIFGSIEAIGGVLMFISVILQGRLKKK